MKAETVKAIRAASASAAFAAPIIGTLTRSTQAQRVSVLTQYLKAGGRLGYCRGHLCLWLSSSEAIIVLEGDGAAAAARDLMETQT